MITEKQSLSIKKKMLEENITVTALAKEFGVSRTLLSSIISGSRNNKLVEEKLKNRYFKKNKGV